MSNLEYIPFGDIDLNDNFFDSLRAGYPGFNAWYLDKAKQPARAYIHYDEDNQIDSFLYIKVEGQTENYSDISPPFQPKKRLKIGTMKVNPRGTRFGERIIKKVMDHALEEQIDEIYVTVFPIHNDLIHLLERFGFKHWGNKSNGENVYVKKIDPNAMTGNRYLDYPLVNLRGVRYWVLAIYPKFHTRMFPDSILKNEDSYRYDLIKDTAETNTISKIYLASMECIAHMSPGDIILIYRTSDGAGPARFRSVITSLCVVEEVKNISQFTSEASFMNYCRKGSVFTDDELTYFYRTKKYPQIIKMTYNLAMTKKVTNGDLIDQVGLNPGYWGCFNITSPQLQNILYIGETNESVLVNKGW